jgi:hypothetical protein
MTCIEVMHNLADFLRGRMAQPEAHSLLLHVSCCADCDLVLGSARKTLETYFNMTERRAQDSRVFEESHAA